MIVYTLTQHWGQESDLIDVFPSEEDAQKAVPLASYWLYAKDDHFTQVASVGHLTYRIRQWFVDPPHQSETDPDKVLQVISA